jgi:hypothetical protein
MSKNAMDMNFLVGKSYTYLKRLLGDRVSIHGDFILSEQSGKPDSSSEGQEEFVNVKSTAAEIGSSQIMANGKVLVDIEHYDMTPTFITQSISGILPPVKIKETPSVPVVVTPSVTPVKAPEVAPTVIDKKEVVAPLDIIKETPIETSDVKPEMKPEMKPEIKPEMQSEMKTPPVETLKTEPPTKPVEKPLNSLQRPPMIALSKDVIQNQLNGLKKTGLPVTGGGEIIYQ